MDLLLEVNDLRCGYNNHVVVDGMNLHIAPGNLVSLLLYAALMTRPVAGVGDIVCVAIKKSLPNCQLDDKKVHKCVIIRTKSPVKRADGSYVRFDSNAAVMIDGDGNPIGTRIFGAVARELREKNYMKIISLASEVV